MKRILIIVLLIVYGQAFAKINFLSTINVYEVNDRKYGKIEVGVFKSKQEDVPKPLVVILGGSEMLPIFKYNLEDKQVYISGFWSFAMYKKDFHIAYINKPGIPLYDTIINHSSEYRIDDFAYKNNTLDFRAASASLAIDMLVSKLKPTSVIVVGYSQGGQVAPKVAVMNTKVNKVVMMSSNALDHIYDRILLARQKALNNLMTHDEAQHVVDSLLTEQKNIYQDSLSIEKKFWGDHYRKWYSYSKTTPLENMLRLQIPILLIASGRDVEGSYIANTDYAMLEFIRKGKTNLTYKVYPNYDHNYRETKMKFGQEVGLGYKFDDVIKDVFEWIRK